MEERDAEADYKRSVEADPSFACKMQRIGASRRRIGPAAAAGPSGILTQPERQSKRIVDDEADDTICVCADGVAPLVAAGGRAEGAG